MSVNVQNVLLYFEDDLINLFTNLNMSSEDKDAITLAKVGMKKDRSVNNIRKESANIQKIIDKYMLNVGETPELIIVQGRLNQIRSLFGVVDVFEVDEE